MVVDAPEAMQVERLMARDAVSVEQARASLRAQVPREARLAIADDVIVNTGRVAELEPQVAALHARYLTAADEKKKTPARSR